MQKLKLDLDGVQVDSFPIEALEASDKGTVHGMSGFDCTTDCYSTTDTIECPCQRQFTNDWEC